MARSWGERMVDGGEGVGGEKEKEGNKNICVLWWCVDDNVVHHHESPVGRL